MNLGNECEESSENNSNSDGDGDGDGDGDEGYDINDTACEVWSEIMTEWSTDISNRLFGFRPSSRACEFKAWS